MTGPSEDLRRRILHVQPLLDPLVPSCLGMDAIGYIQEHRHHAADLSGHIHLRPVAAVHDTDAELGVRDGRLELDSLSGQRGFDMTAYHFVGRRADHFGDELPQLVPGRGRNGGRNCR